MISSGGRVVILLVSLAAAAEVYDEAPAVDFAYQEGNDIDTGPFDRMEPSADDVMLFRLLAALARDQTGLQFRPNLHESDPNLDPRVHPAELKQTVFKRLPSPLRQARPQQKWKIKKGKALGSQMVCYFKLCAFRPH